MSTGYNILGTHVGDFLSVNVSETVTVGNTGLSTTLRIYDCNAPLNGYLLTTSNGIFTINEANNSIPTNVGIGTNIPTRGSTLQVQGTFLTSNIGTYTGKTLYFNNNTLAGISNINTFGTITTSTAAYGDNSCNVATTSYVQSALAQFTGGDAITGNSSNMPKLTSIGTSNLTTTIQGNLTVNSNLTVKGIVAQTNQFGFIALSPIIQTNSSCNIFVTSTSSGIVYPMMSTVLNNVTTPYATPGLNFNVDTQTLTSSNIVIDNSIMYNNAFGQITLGSVVQQTDLVPFSNITNLPRGSIPYGAANNYMSNVSGTTGQVLISGGTNAPVWTNSIVSQVTDTTNAIYIKNNAYVGIGTTNPLTLFSVTANVASGIGPILSINNTGGFVNATSVLEFNTYSSAGTNNTYPPCAQIRVIDDGTAAANMAFLTKQNGIGTNPLNERMRITSLGYVGIGTTNPTSQLSVNGTITATTITATTITATSNIANYNSVSLNSGINANYYIGMYNNSTGSLEPLTDQQLYWNPSSNIINLAGITATGQIITSNISGTGPALKVTQQGTTQPVAQFVAGTTNALYIDNTGNVGIGTTNPGGRLNVFTSDTGGVLLGNVTASFDVNAVVQIQGVASSKSALATCLSATNNQTHIGFNNNSGASGTIVRVGNITTNASATTYNTSSDYRLKTNVRPLENASSIIQQLKPVTFNFNCDLTTDVDGFIAHEVQELVPLAVTGTKDAVQEDGTIDPQGMDSKMLIPHLVKCCQELMEKVQFLTDRITALEQN